MIGLRLSGWVLARWGSRPAPLGLAVAIAGIGWLLARWIELGVVSPNMDLPALVVVSAFLAGAVGTSAAAAELADIEPELCRLGAVQRTLTELAPLWISGALLQALVIVSTYWASPPGAPPESGSGFSGHGWLLGGDLPAGAAWSTQPLAVAGTQFHLACLGLLLLRSPVPRSALLPSLLVLVWMLPALLAHHAGWIGRFVRVAFESGSLARLRWPAAAVDEHVRVAPLAALGCIALCAGLASPYPRRSLGLRGDRGGGRGEE